MSDNSIPAELHPRSQDYPFDLDRTLSAVVGIRALVPDDASTASVLGTERTGSGVVIDPKGLVLTIGYLIVEAETIWLTTGDGRALPGYALAYDGETGLGLVQALGRLDLPALELGDSSGLSISEAVILAAFGGRSQAVKARLVGRQHFAGYWEYLIEDALYTAPHHPNWGGAALIDRDGRLVGIGSLILQQQVAETRALSLNMVVPIDVLKPILESLRNLGRTEHAPRPWLGVYANEQQDAIVVDGLAEGGPAQVAGIQLGDHILAVGDTPVSDLRELWLNVWAAGPAGATVHLQIERGQDTLDLAVTSADRARYLRSPSLQ
jgi:S1-C subfamily serine protease